MSQSTQSSAESSAELVERTARHLREKSGDRPDSDRLVAALLDLEKVSPQRRQQAEFDRLLGTWRLAWITGTKRSRQRAGAVLGSGRYLPGFIDIRITYRATGENTERTCGGRVENAVRVGGLNMTVTGPIAWQNSPTTPEHRRKTLLAFDFTRLNAKLFGITLFDGFVGDGERREETFPQKSIAQQAFFNYFYLGEGAIAARGRGGGLAIWYAVG